MKKLYFFAISFLIFLSCVTTTNDYNETEEHKYTSFIIENKPNGFADVKWVLNSDKSMQFYMRLLEDDKEYAFDGSWYAKEDIIYVNFIAESLYLSALFDWNGQGENNIKIISDRQISFKSEILETDVYGVKCTVSLHKNIM